MNPRNHFSDFSEIAAIMAMASIGVDYSNPFNEPRIKVYARHKKDSEAGPRGATCKGKMIRLKKGRKLIKIA